MQKLNYLLFILTAILLTGCSGSETYRGMWKATDPEGVQFEITFEAKKFIIKRMDRESRDFGYSQNSVHMENFVETYGISLDDGRRYQIIFPIADDESVGIIKDGNGSLTFTISRNEYISYQDIYKLN